MAKKGMLIYGGILVTGGTNAKVINDGAVYFEDGVIQATGKSAALKKKYRTAQKINAQNKVIMPGFICAHHHLYSTMARGIKAPLKPSSNFVEILKNLWWKLDKALLEKDVYYSAVIPLIECIKHGTTTIIDHHASPSFRDGSLNLIKKAVKESGIRASLCYEVSDRNKKGAGIEENEKFLKSVKSNDAFIQGMSGMHASFTVGNDSLEKCARQAEKYGVGVHIHVAEDKADQNHSLKTYKKRVIERLHKAGCTGEKSIFVHCVHINANEMKILKDTGTIVVHNPESNMNNAVGTSPVLEMMKKGVLVGLGTDGMSSNMLQQLRCAYLLHRHANADPQAAFMEAPQMLLDNNAEIANRMFPAKLGFLRKGFAADIILVDYIPPTVLDSANFLGHLLFALPNAQVDTTIVGGKVLMRDKKLVKLNEKKLAAECAKNASKMWKRF